MIYELRQKDFYKVKNLIKNSDYELSVEAVIVGNTHGKVYVNNLDAPESTLIVTPECNVVAGHANNREFNEEVKKKLDFYDQVTCDDEKWENNIHEIHSNISTRKYTRRYYKFDKLKYKNYEEKLDKQFVIEYVNSENLHKINYINSDEIKEWIRKAFIDLDKFKDACLGAYIRTDDMIVSWCIADCKVDDRIEIGVTSDEEFRKKGLGSIVVAAAVSSFLKDGVKDIGWHCVDTNVGSYTLAEKVGFRKVKEYYSFTPYPPIENKTDLNSEQWADWARHYEKANKLQPKFHWTAAQCWAKANRVEETIQSLKNLLDSGWECNTQKLQQYETFLRFKENTQWIKFIDSLNRMYI